MRLFLGRPDRGMTHDLLGGVQVAGLVVDAARGAMSKLVQREAPTPARSQQRHGRSRINEVMSVVQNMRGRVGLTATRERAYSLPELRRAPGGRPAASFLVSSRTSAAPLRKLQRFTRTDARAFRFVLRHAASGLTRSDGSRCSRTPIPNSESLTEPIAAVQSSRRRRRRSRQ